MGLISTRVLPPTALLDCHTRCCGGTFQRSVTVGFSSTRCPQGRLKSPTRVGVAIWGVNSPPVHRCEPLGVAAAAYCILLARSVTRYGTSRFCGNVHAKLTRPYSGRSTSASTFDRVEAACLWRALPCWLKATQLFPLTYKCVGVDEPCEVPAPSKWCDDELTFLRRGIERRVPRHKLRRHHYRRCSASMAVKDVA
jgi:hypothetical protein